MSQLSEIKVKDLVQANHELEIISPKEQIAVMEEWASALMDVVQQKHLYQDIQGKKYLLAEAWEIILSFAHTGSVPEYVREVYEDNEIVGYEAKIVLIKNGETVGGAIMSCGLDEFPCRGKTGQAKAKAAKSAAQTWAMSKAARLKYSLVPILAGYEATPAEEMIVTVDQSEAPQQRRQQPTDIINAKQRGRLFAIQKATAEKNGGHPTDNEVREYMENMYDKVSTQKLTVEECDDVVAWIESQATEI
jgi:hypothetical protein